jgi:hypothetical protein
VTIAVAVRTPTSVVFAADSKLTTVGLVGFEAGEPRWETQTFDHYTKVTHDRGQRLMAVVAGHANLGAISATDFIAMQEFPASPSNEEQDAALERLLDAMCAARREFWSQTQVDPAEWPGPTLLLTLAPAVGFAPRSWHVSFNGDSSEKTPILKQPGVHFEGSFLDVFGVMYGWRSDFCRHLGKELGVPYEQLRETLAKGEFLRPLDRMNFLAMPLQDAVDLAVFLATVQIEMDRFLPGHAACGGAIDVMVLRATPEPGILSMFGNKLTHPVLRGRS